MPNDNDNKLVTLADLGEAYNALYARDVMDASDKTKLDGIEAGAQVNTVTSVNNKTGAVSLTPADIGAPTTTGSGASGIWNINIPFSGSGTTGFKSFSLNEINIDDTPGSWVAGFSDRTNHGTFPTWNMWWTIVRQYESEGFIFQVANQLTDVGKSFYMSFRGKWNNGGSWGPWKDIINDDAVPITSGGTGMTGCTQINYTSPILDNSSRVRVYSWGMICVAVIAGYASTDITADVTPILSIGDGNYFPSNYVGSTFTGSDGASFYVQLGPNGQIKSPFKTISQGTWIFGQIVWLRGV